MEHQCAQQHSKVATHILAGNASPIQTQWLNVRILQKLPLPRSRPSSTSNTDLRYLYGQSPMMLPRETRPTSPWN